jgi:FkbM family methyltransferase
MSERKIREWALPRIRNFRTYIDIGAHKGDTSFGFSKTFKKVIAFEPNPETYSILSANTSVESYNIALGSFTGKTQLIVPFKGKPQWGSTSPLRNSQWTSELSISYDVEIKKLDDYHYVDVDFIKIDVEQAEMDVILGAIETINNNKPVIMFENKRHENQCIIEFLSNIGYSIDWHKSDTIAYFEE